MTTLVHPVQKSTNWREGAWVSASVTRRAYEVYAHLFGTNQTLDQLNQRGGLGTNELIVFLYAHGFPQDEWKARVKEAREGMVGI